MKITVLTKEQEKEVIRVCGPNYTEQDIPAYMRGYPKVTTETKIAKELEPLFAQEIDELKPSLDEMEARETDYNNLLLDEIELNNR